MVTQATKDLLIFDMDGVLVEVTESYRETIQQTVEHFTGTRPERETIQQWKNRGGWNDDWALSHALIKESGIDVDYDKVVEHFQELFHGGLMERERWIANDGLFTGLTQTANCAVFTGRQRWEAHLTLKRFDHNMFDPVVGVDDVSRPKPNPEGILKIREMVPHNRVWYIGDTVDDARAAKAANVPFIGIAAQNLELKSLLQSEGAQAVLEDINSLGACL